MCDGQEVPLGEWLRRESVALHERHAGNRKGSNKLWVYWWVAPLALHVLAWRVACFSTGCSHVGGT